MSKLLFIYIFLQLQFYSQIKTRYAWPLDSPINLTGFYGEIRQNHFHTGIDLSTNGEINKNVYSIDNGFIYRIKVSSTGNGKTIYVSHPNGTVSVYCHLNNFNKMVNKMVENEQITKKNYEVELFPEPFTLPVNKNEIIAYSGNTGNSTGPHLHFEIRNEKTEATINPLINFQLNNQIKPIIEKIAIFSLADSSNPVLLKKINIINKNNTLSIKNNTLIINQSILGIAIKGFDKFLYKNSNDISSVIIYLDSSLIYSHFLNNIDFSDVRYVNEFYEIIENKKFQKCFMPTLYPKYLYNQSINNGKIILNDNNFHVIKFLVKDFYGNENTLKLFLKTTKINKFKNIQIKKNLYVDCTKEFKFEDNNLNVSIPKNTFYNSYNLTVLNNIEKYDDFSILPSKINLKTPISISFKLTKKQTKFYDKIIIKNEKKTYSVTKINDFIYFESNKIGKFKILYDTICPTIKLKSNTKENKKIKKINSIVYIISDNLSGINKYNLYINDNWVISEYDYKNNQLTYSLNSETQKILHFKLEIEDKVGNKSIFEHELLRN